MSSYLTGWENYQKDDLQDLCCFNTCNSFNSSKIPLEANDNNRSKEKYYFPVRKKRVRSRQQKDCSVIQMNETFIKLQSKISLHDKLISKYGKNKENKSKERPIGLVRRKLENMSMHKSKFSVVNLLQKLQINKELAKKKPQTLLPRNKFLTISKPTLQKTKKRQKIKSSSLDLLNMLSKRQTENKREVIFQIFNTTFYNKLNFPNLIYKNYKSQSQHKHQHQHQYQHQHQHKRYH